MELPCAASGYPIPAIRWLKDGRPLPADSRWAKRITGLTISDLRTEDSGTYICEVTNTFGSAEANGILTVIGESGACCGPRNVWECWPWCNGVPRPCRIFSCLLLPQEKLLDSGLERPLV